MAASTTDYSQIPYILKVHLFKLYKGSFDTLLLNSLSL